MILYSLEHVYEKEEHEEEIKFIGIYSTHEEAEKVISLYKTKPGFKRYPNNFFINEVVLGASSWSSGFASIDHATIFTSDGKEIELMVSEMGNDRYELNENIEELGLKTGQILSGFRKEIDGIDSLILNYKK